MNDFKKLTNSYQKEIIKSLQDCIKIKSVSGDQAGTLQALNFFLDLGRSMGFKATNIEDLGGIIEFGEGEKTIGIIAHLDTVPEGTGWKFPPFEGQVQDGKIYGRGAIDDKGPAISALYALKAIKDLGMKPARKIQIIIGIDEETVWNTTPQLLKKIKEPNFSFVPDSKFPIVIAEKGLLWLEIKKDFTPATVEAQTTAPIIIKEMHGGGESLNIVPDYCEATLLRTEGNTEAIEEKLKGFLQKEKSFNLKLEKNRSALKLLSYGKSAHAFSCDEGQNAISQLISFLSQLDIAEEQKQFLNIYHTKIGMEHFGDSLGLALEDELTGKLTVSPGFILLDEKSVTLKVDLRYPASEQLASLKTKTKSSFQVFGGTLKMIDSLESLRFPEDDPNIRKLLRVYRDFTGDSKAEPLGMGGTTFAKAFKRAVGFGPTFPGMAKVEHQPDEYMEIAHLMKCTELYTLALKELITD